MLTQGFYDRTHLAMITAVDQAAGTVTIMFIDQVGIRTVPLPVVTMSSDAWIRFIPQVNDVVACGMRPDDSLVILGWFPYNYGKRITAFNAKDKNAAGGELKEMMQELKPGELDLRSKGGGYLRLDAVGDVLLMSLAGRIQMYGREGFTALTQLGLKLTDGKSWMRFGAPFRLFPKVSERELPTSGTGQPLDKPSDLRECDTRLFDGHGNLLVQESLGTVIDEQGSLELSGTSGSGSSQSVPKTSAASVTDFASVVADPAKLADSVQGIADHVASAVTDYVQSIVGGVTSLVSGVQTVYTNLSKSSVFTDNVADLVSDVQGIVTGAGAISDGLDKIQGLGDKGKTLRYRLMVNKDGKQVAAFDIDENGGIVLASESDVGTNINANKGGLTLFAKKGMKLFAKGVQGAFDTLGFNTTKDMKLVSGTKMSRSAGTDIADSAQNITLAASEETAIGGGTSVTLVVDTSSVTIDSSGVTVQTSGDATVNASGSVDVTGGTISITGGTVTITGGLVTIN